MKLQVIKYIETTNIKTKAKKECLVRTKGKQPAKKYNKKIKEIQNLFLLFLF